MIGRRLLSFLHIGLVILGFSYYLCRPISAVTPTTEKFVSSILSEDEIEKKCEEFLRVEGIWNPNYRETQLVRIIVHEREVARRALNIDKQTGEGYLGLCVLQIIQFYEEEFEKPACEALLGPERPLFKPNDNLTCNYTNYPKFEIDKDKLFTITRHSERMSEIRHQKWLFFLQNPPTPFVAELTQQVLVNMSIPAVARGVTLIMKNMATPFQDGFIKNQTAPLRFKLRELKLTLDVVNVLLSNVKLTGREFFSYTGNATSACRESCPGNLGRK